MGLRDLQKEVLDKAHTEAALVLASARQEAKDVFSNAKQEAERIEREARVKALEEAGAQKAETLAAARLEAKAFNSRAQSRVVDSVLAELKEQLSAFASSKDYEKVFAALVEEGKKGIGGDCVLIVCKKDAVLARKYGTVSSEFLDSIGGVIVSSTDGRIRVNNSFEALLEEKQEALKQLIFEELRGGEKATRRVEVPVKKRVITASSKPVAKTETKASAKASVKSVAKKQAKIVKKKK